MTVEPETPPERRRRPIIGLILSILIVVILLGLLFAGLFYWRQMRVGEQQGWAQTATAVTAMVVLAARPSVRRS